MKASFSFLWERSSFLPFRVFCFMAQSVRCRWAFVVPGDALSRMPRWAAGRERYTVSVNGHYDPFRGLGGKREPSRPLVFLGDGYLYRFSSRLVCHSPDSGPNPPP